MNGLLIDSGGGHTCCVTHTEDGVRVIVGRVIGPAFVGLAEYMLSGEGARRARSSAGWNIASLAALLAEVLARHDGRGRSALLEYMRDRAVVELRRALSEQPRSWARILRILHAMQLLGVRLQTGPVGDMRQWPRSARDAVLCLSA